MRNKVSKFAALLALLLVAIVLVGCDGKISTTREASVSFRDENFARAQALHPEPSQVNFPLRALLVEYTQRQDLVNHPWYTYILGENGNVVSYFVSTTMPLNACTFLSSSEDVRDDRYGGNLKMTAPSLDGIFYGGAGASAACTGWIVKDAATNAMGIIYGDKLLVFDQPLLLEAEPVRLQIDTSHDPPQEVEPEP